MAKYSLPQTDFEQHPEGQFTGRITEVRDMGMKQTQWGEKHRIAIVIESDTATKENGEPIAHFEFVNLSKGSNSKLTKMRQKLLRRPLTPEENASDFDDVEFTGKRVNYTIEHEYGNDGKVWAKVVSWSLLGQGGGAAQAREDVQSPQEEAPQRDAPPVEAYNDDLPF